MKKTKIKISKISKMIPTFSLNGCFCGEGLYGRFNKCKFGGTFSADSLLAEAVGKYFASDAEREKLEYKYGGKIGDWDVSKVKNFSRVFSTDRNDIIVGGVVLGQAAGLKAFNVDISKWDTSSATDMTEMFYGCENFNQDISSWDTSNVESMEGMFGGCKAFNQDINKWNVAKVKKFSGMFGGCKTFDKDIGSWNLEAAVTVYEMFHGCEAFNQNIGNWKLTSVDFDGGVPSPPFDFDTPKLGGLDRMFYNCKKFNQDISKWDLNTIFYMTSMFEGCESFDQDISKWNVSKVKEMDRMFFGCKAFNQDISGWDVSTALSGVGTAGNAGKKCYNMFNGATSMKKEKLPKLLQDSDIVYKAAGCPDGSDPAGSLDLKWARQYTSCSFPTGCPWAGQMPKGVKEGRGYNLNEECMYATFDTLF